MPSLLGYIRDIRLHRRSLALGKGSYKKALLDSLRYDLSDLSEYLLTEHKDKIQINEPLEKGYGALALAIQYSSARIVSLIINRDDFNKDALINNPTPNPIFFKVVRNQKHNKIDIISVLLPIYSLDQKGRDRVSLLTLCAARGWYKEIRYLVENGCDPLYEINNDRSTYYSESCPLFCSLKYNSSPECFSLMLELSLGKAEELKIEIYGRMLSIICSYLSYEWDFKNFIKITKYLLSRGAHPEYSNNKPLINSKKKPLESLNFFHLSIPELEQVLEIFSPHLDINGPKDDNGSYVLNLVQDNCVPETHKLIRLLSRYGANFNTVAHTYTSRLAKEEIFEPLWFKILNDELRSPNWDEPAAKKYDTTDLLRALVDCGIMINSKNSQGEYFSQTLPSSLSKNTKIEIANLLRNFGMRDEALAFIE